MTALAFSTSLFTSAPSNTDSQVPLASPDPPKQRVAKSPVLGSTSSAQKECPFGNWYRIPGAESFTVRSSFEYWSASGSLDRTASALGFCSALTADTLVGSLAPKLKPFVFCASVAGTDGFASAIAGTAASGCFSFESLDRSSDSNQ